MQSVRRASAVLSSAATSSTAGRVLGQRYLHSTRPWNAISNFAMPAMSPTMTEGGVAQWKVKEGQAFVAGDVLLEVETDKATIDVEAPEDGVMGKIIAPDGSKNIPVGKTIALLAEEGDDISNLEVPKEESSTPPPPKTQEEAAKPQVAKTPEVTPSKSSSHELHIQHSKPLFPSVQRLLTENGVENADKIKGTGVRGMLTKGDVLAFLGKASSPLGTYKPPNYDYPEIKKVKEEPKALGGQAIRQLIAANFSKSSSRARAIPPPAVPYDFDSVIADYLPSESKQAKQGTTKPTSSSSFLDGLL